MKRWFGSGSKRAESWMGILVGLPARLVGIVIVAVAWTSMGCDSNSFVPPRPPELQGGAVATSPKGTSAVPSAATPPLGGKAIELVLGRHEGEDAESVKGSAMKQAGSDKVRHRIALLSNQEPPARQVGLVREAVARHPLALILEPTDPGDPALAAAVREAQDAGVPVVLVARPLMGGNPATDAAKSTTSSSARPPILVAPAPFAPIAEQMVASAIRNAKTANLSPQGGAVILVDLESDPFADQRVAAVRTALEAAGITKIDLLHFQREGTRAVKLLTDYLGANPKTTLVFSLDYQSFTANKQVCDSIAEKRPFISAGYTTDDNFAGIASVGEFAAVSQLGGTRLLRKAITTALNASQGRDVPDRIEVPIAFFDSSRNAGLPRVPDSGRAKPKPFN